MGTHIREHTYTYTKKTCLRKLSEKGCSEVDHGPCPCPDASDFRVGNIKQTQKQDPAMRVLGWMTEAASKYWDCISPIAMVTRTGWILAERERKKTGKTMSLRRMSECMDAEPLVRAEGAEPREEV